MKNAPIASREIHARKAGLLTKVSAKLWGSQTAQSTVRLVSSAASILLVLLGAHVIHAQQKAAAGGSGGQVQAPLYTPEQQHQFLRWAIPASDQAYASIDGDHLHDYVKEFAEISDRYRDQGHQWWGRIMGTESDSESRKWVLEKFKQAGLENVHEQELDLAPQWMPQSWSVVVNGAGKTLNLQTAQPTAGTAGTPGQGLDLEAVYVGLGSEADFAGKDVRGKAVFLYSIPVPNMFRHSAGIEGASKRAEEKGAAAIFIVLALQGNIRTQMYPQGTTVPTFSMGLDEGQSVRDLIGSMPAGQAPKVSVRLDVKTVPNLKSGTEWGELPGMTDEKVVIIAHRDGWFEGATDNASGMATMIGLAEYFAKIPKAQRRRTIIFAGTTGHHGVSSVSGSPTILWMHAHKDDVLAKTALIINCEHTAVALTPVHPNLGGIAATNASNPLLWYIGGSAQLRSIALKDFDEFGIARYSVGRPAGFGEVGGIYKDAPSLQLTDIGVFNHADRETPDVVPATGLAAVTRAYAKIVTDLNAVDLKDIVAPPESAK